MQNILLGQQIVVYTNHKNLTYNNFHMEHVMRWRLLIEEFGHTIEYIKGPKNIVANVLSRIIEYPMIGFLAMRYFFCPSFECAMIKQAFLVAMH